MSFDDLLRPSCALFLDFDGTLVDIAPSPEAVVVPQGLVEILERMHGYLGGALAIVTGRQIDDVDGFLSPLRLPSSGVHGAERRGADGQLSLLPVPSLALVDQVATGLATQHPRLHVEIKRGSVALHYRLAPELEAVCQLAMQTAVENSTGLSLMHGKMVFEAKAAKASKGKAIEAFMHEAPFAGRIPIFIGDDITDEGGFTAVQGLGGVGVKVGAGSTTAFRRVDTPAATRQVLENAVAGAAALRNARNLP